MFKVLGPSFKLKILSSHRFFDREWYVNYYYDIKKNGLDPLDHYRSHGFREGRAPNGWAGASLGVVQREASSLDDIKLVEHTHLVAESGLFDDLWYAQTYGIDQTHALRHFLTDGTKEATDPNMFFSSSTYYRNNPDVVQAGWNALVHFIDVGYVETRPGHLSPRFDRRSSLKESDWRSGLGRRA